MLDCDWREESPARAGSKRADEEFANPWFWGQFGISEEFWVWSQSVSKRGLLEWGAGGSQDPSVPRKSLSQEKLQISTGGLKGSKC